MTAMTLYKQLSSLVFGACIMSMLASCGGNVSSGGGEGEKNPYQDSNGTGGTTTTPVVEEELDLVGRYKVKFSPLNSAVAGLVSAEGEFQVMGDNFSSTLEVKNSSAYTTHYQFIYTGNECPTVETHDTNGDGFIDPIEASKVTGQILVPLDDNLNSQLEGIGKFEMSGIYGNYEYFREGKLPELTADLMAPDNYPRDEMTKLKRGEEFKLEGKVVVIQGVSRDVYLPGSIQIFEGATHYDSLPIACGKIERVRISESETTQPQ